MLSKDESLAAAIWRDPLPDHIKTGALIIVVERRGVYRRFFTANAAAAWGRIDRHSHISRFWGFDYERCEASITNPGLVLRIAKNERELEMLYKMRATNQAMLQAMKGVVDAE